MIPEVTSTWAMLWKHSGVLLPTHLTTVRRGGVVTPLTTAVVNTDGHSTLVFFIVLLHLLSVTGR